MAGDDSMVESRGENPLRFDGSDCRFFGRNCRFKTKCFSFFLGERMMMALPASQFYLKSNVLGGTRRLPMRNEVSRKSPPANGRGRTYSNSMRGGRAPKNMQVSSSRYPIAKTPVASRSEREREREPRRRMMMENKRGVEPYAEDDDEEQMSLAVR